MCVYEINLYETSEEKVYTRFKIAFIKIVILKKNTRTFQSIPNRFTRTTGYDL